MFSYSFINLVGFFIKVFSLFVQNRHVIMKYYFLCAKYVSYILLTWKQTVNIQQS